MLFHVRMDVNIPRDLPAEEAAEIIAKEKAYSQDLQRIGKWRHIWRIAGEYANFSVFDVQDNAELHEVLSGLPLFKFMTIKVTPLLKHPSSIREDDK
ncbi:muconolactone Delta-isomerase [Agrobacterium genomosp. 3]|uniref:muconolactone Delta-isomerase n=1 Tax=Agrobacterium TaxID=357 RepID=UPI0011D71682|nr:muconolactone Delta-isomerase [Agrobacterium pusense]MCA1867953.1 muconolactone Delta-isomerase [Agrobacterium tomkonis]MCA1878354.1 muconolactone Delta-isomerase [Agrobacterium tumefaciens]TXI02976.1 MAG: muconolactone Delta-isomerase [Rhizobium sp.]MCA1893528.1 muconolactone Delta-isomerase [Agrobacterium tomkonis]MDH0117060.1 muconolactone Delta-isomerase [Agrobacterium pusense]